MLVLGEGHLHHVIIQQDNRISASETVASALNKLLSCDVMVALHQHVSAGLTILSGGYLIFRTCSPIRFSGYMKRTIAKLYVCHRRSLKLLSGCFSVSLCPTGCHCEMIQRDSSEVYTVHSELHDMMDICAWECLETALLFYALNTPLCRALEN